jgi:glucosamine kinase
VYYAGVDGGGTRTTLGLADAAGRELARRSGPAGLVDPRDPAASARVVAGLLREAREEAGLTEPPVALCAGLAGVGNPAEREAVRAALVAEGVAARVCVTTDGEVALEGAMAGGAGVLLIAGTGSVAYGRAEDGRVDRCGGWGMIVGDEGSGWSIGRAGLAAALRAADGRGPRTALLPRLLETLELRDPRGIPPWAGRAEKGDVAALAAHVIAAADGGDDVALGILRREAGELALHAVALASRLGPWSGDVPVVFHGGVLGRELFADLVGGALAMSAHDFAVRPAAEDAVAGALRCARRVASAAVPAEAIATH